MQALSDALGALAPAEHGDVAPVLVVLEHVHPLHGARDQGVHSSDVLLLVDEQPQLVVPGLRARRT